MRHFINGYIYIMNSSRSWYKLLPTNCIV